MNGCDALLHCSQKKQMRSYPAPFVYKVAFSNLPDMKFRIFQKWWIFKKSFRVEFKTQLECFRNPESLIFHLLARARKRSFSKFWRNSKKKKSGFSAIFECRAGEMPLSGSKNWNETGAEQKHCLSPQIKNFGAKSAILRILVLHGLISLKLKIALFAEKMASKLGFCQVWVTF